MSNFKLIIGVFIVFIFTYFGYILGKKYTYKRKFFQDFYNFNVQYKQEVSFAHTTLNKIIDENSDNIFILKLKVYIQNKNDDDLRTFTEDEINLFNNYCINVIRGDSATLLSFLKSQDDLLKDKLSMSIKNEKKYKNLYLKIGFLIGLTILIIFI